MVFDTRSKYFKLLYCIKFAEIEDSTCPSYFYNGNFIAIGYIIAEDPNPEKLLKKLVLNDVF
jgi:hypothetical protein